ncbi:peptidase P60 [Bombiscardovia apis]|uniref:Peptidase P60 n=1 Tax=Bombiscardovia apis TaxID=2932182 RepID=A0ABM8BDR8_9BIFI|nr:C40 family peptidase [Bombiscardovia apis]BDR55055.1 peptidase P60 [Bombiscardovia apis]
MKKQAKHWKVALVTLCAGSAFLATVPALAYAGSQSERAVTSSRSFTPSNRPRKDLLAESTATTVDSDSNWGGVESLSVPQTKSQAEKDSEARAQAEAKARKEAEERAAAQAAQAQRQAQTQAAAQAASRSAERTSPQATTVAPPNGASSSAVVQYAVQFVNQVPYVSGGKSPSGWDCSGFVQYVYGQFGISAPAPSGTQATLGRAVPSIDQAMPGDIIANGAHAGIYVGNGLVVNALSPGQGTQITPISVAFTGSYAIRRIL